MKINHYLPLLLFSILLSSYSCKKKKLDCKNGGVYDAENEICICEEGYGDGDCGIELREFAIGTFKVNLSGMENNNPYTVIMSKSPDDILRVNISMDKEPFNGNFVGMMGNSYLDIPLQTINGETFSGYIHSQPNMVLTLQYDYHSYAGILIAQ